MGRAGQGGLATEDVVAEEAEWAGLEGPHFIFSVRSKRGSATTDIDGIYVQFGSIAAAEVGKNFMESNSAGGGLRARGGMKVSGSISVAFPSSGIRTQSQA